MSKVDYNKLVEFIKEHDEYYVAEIMFGNQKRIAELEQELAKYKELQDRLGLKNADEFEWFVMLDLLTDNEKNMHILDLHRELAELKENAIVPRFKLGQKVWYVYNKYQKFPFRCVIDKIVYDSSKNHKFRYDTSGELYIGIKEEDLFATEQEAQEKLKEMQGNE